jgi:hypothetical protein
MQVIRSHVVLAVSLCSVLGSLGCSKEKSQEGRIQIDLGAESGRKWQPPSQLAAQKPINPNEAPKVALLQAPSNPPGPASDIRIGIPRDNLVNTLGACGVRIFFLPPSSSRLVVEVFQPKPQDKTCVDRFGAKRFMAVGGVLKEIHPGLEEATPAPAFAASPSSAAPAKAR